jgi:hypothetical protein
MFRNKTAPIAASVMGMFSLSEFSSDLLFKDESMSAGPLPRGLLFDPIAIYSKPTSPDWLVSTPHKPYHSMAKAEETPLTYEQLAALRAEEWATAQRTMAKNIADLHASIVQMPDVAGAPGPNVPWSHPDIMCPCGEMTFLVPRWVTVNGVRHRAELVCTGCKCTGTWDWSLKSWLPTSGT